MKGSPPKVSKYQKPIFIKRVGGKRLNPSKTSYRLLDDQTTFLCVLHTWENQEEEMTNDTKKGEDENEDCIRHAQKRKERVMTRYSLVDGEPSFRGTYHLHLLYWWWRQINSPKRQYPSAILHGVTQRTKRTFAAVETCNLINKVPSSMPALENRHSTKQICSFCLELNGIYKHITYKGIGHCDRLCC